ncbi:hypothetical protein ACJX0J_031597, partial [Zea mays]
RISWTLLISTPYLMIVKKCLNNFVADLLIKKSIQSNIKIFDLDEGGHVIGSQNQQHVRCGIILGYKKNVATTMDAIDMRGMVKVDQGYMEALDEIYGPIWHASSG